MNNKIELTQDVFNNQPKEVDWCGVDYDGLLSFGIGGNPRYTWASERWRGFDIIGEPINNTDYKPLTMLWRVTIYQMGEVGKIKRIYLAHKVLKRCFIFLYICPAICFGQSKDSVYSNEYLDTFKVNTIIYADSTVGIVYKKNNKTIIRKTIQFLHSDRISHPLSDNEIILLYDENFKELDWIIYQIGDEIKSRFNQGNLSQIFLRN